MSHTNPSTSGVQSPDLSRFEGFGGDSFAPSVELGAGVGREAPLVLIEGHLTDIPCATGFREGFGGGRLLKNWEFPSEWAGPSGDGFAQVLKVQPFKQGGYEATIRSLNLRRIGSAIEFGGCRGKREAKEQDHRDVEKAAARAKRKVRHLVKNMAATHLATLSKREGPNTRGWTPAQWLWWESGGRQQWEDEHGAFWTPEDWARAWDKFRRNVERVMGSFPYVAILERHRKGNFHLHVAWLGRLNLNVLRPMWWLSCGGRGQGNIDAKFIKVRQGLDRSNRIASYISKYVSKMFEEFDRFNKKRYWASKQTLEDVRRIVLRSSDLDGSLREVSQMLGLDWGKFVVAKHGRMEHENLFVFPDGSGVWINFIPELHNVDPPF